MDIGIQTFIGNNTTPINTYAGTVYCPSAGNGGDPNTYIGNGGAGVVLISNVHYDAASTTANLVIINQSAFSGGQPGDYGGNFTVSPI
jgi:hypothetical protein